MIYFSKPGPSMEFFYSPGLNEEINFDLENSGKQIQDVNTA